MNFPTATERALRDALANEPLSDYARQLIERELRVRESMERTQEVRNG